MLETLNTLSIDNQQQVLSLSIKQITEGMIAAEDIVAKNGGPSSFPKDKPSQKSCSRALKNFSTQVGVVEPVRIQIGAGQQGEEGVE